MRINLDYKRPAVPPAKPGEEQPKHMSNAEITFDYIMYAVGQKYKEGLDGQLRRLWGRIQRKFDEAILDQKDEIELDQSEQDFIKKAFSECKYNFGISKYVNILEDELDNLGKKVAKA